MRTQMPGSLVKHKRHKQHAPALLLLWLSAAFPLSESCGTLLWRFDAHWRNRGDVCPTGQTSCWQPAVTGCWRHVHNYAVEWMEL